MRIDDTLRTASEGRSDVGRSRQRNEDSFVADDELSLYVLGDGVGSYPHGDVASAESVAFVHAWIALWRETIDAFVGEPCRGTEELVCQLLESAVHLAGRIVYGMGQLHPGAKGMSSTLSSVLCAGRLGFIAQVGDSRVYHARARRCRQVTEDHTLANHCRRLGSMTPEQMARMSAGNVITRAVGHDERVQVDTLTVPIEPGDRFLICSDGLHTYLKEGELDDLVAGDRAGVAERLIELANVRGGDDNVTVIVCDVLAARPRSELL